MAGVIHDVGEITLSTEILSKPTKLSDIEFSLIREHVRLGYDILKDVESPWPLAEIVLQHHERMDGSGYPRGLKEEEILIEARILAVADVVEAMASHRPIARPWELTPPWKRLRRTRASCMTRPLWMYASGYSGIRDSSSRRYAKMICFH